MNSQSEIIKSKIPKYKSWRVARLFRHKLALLALVYIVLLIILSSLAPWIAPYSFDERHPGAENIIFSAEHWFGTDPLGRDLFSRNLFAARNALFISVSAVLAGLFMSYIVFWHFFTKGERPEPEPSMPFAKISFR